MFAYLIIGIELVILYFVFWVVFIREPKAREIRAELWGHYERMQENSTKSVSFLPSRIKARLYRIRKLRNLHYIHYIKHHCNCKCHNTAVQANNWCKVPVQVDRQQDINRQLAEKFLLVLNKTLNKFSVKIPYLSIGL